MLSKVSWVSGRCWSTSPLRPSEDSASPSPSPLPLPLTVTVGSTNAALIPPCGSPSTTLNPFTHAQIIPLQGC